LGRTKDLRRGGGGRSSILQFLPQTGNWNKSIERKDGSSSGNKNDYFLKKQKGETGGITPSVGDSLRKGVVFRKGGTKGKKSSQ